MDVVESVESGEVSVMMKQASAKAEQGTTARKATRMLMKIKNSSGTKPASVRSWNKCVDELQMR